MAFVANRTYQDGRLVPRTSAEVTKVAVGGALPPSVEFFANPADVAVQTQDRYTVVIDRTLLVDPGARKVIQLIE